MMLGELVDRLIDLKLSGEPGKSSWISIDESSKLRRLYWAEIEDIKQQISRLGPPSPQSESSDHE